MLSVLEVAGEFRSLGNLLDSLLLLSQPTRPEHGQEEKEEDQGAAAKH
jgi:hypothetical protein